MLNLSQGVEACSTLNQINLRAVGVCHQHVEALRSFADVISNHAALQDVNIDGNLIGEAACCLTKQDVNCLQMFLIHCGVLRLSTASRQLTFACRIEVFRRHVLKM